jgi:CofH/MqnC C-terminal region
MTDMEINAAIADRARAGEVLSDAELRELDTCDVLSLGMLADEARRARVGDTVTYCRVLVVGPGGLAEDAATDSALAQAHEVRFATTAATLDDSCAAIRQARQRLGATRRITGFSLAEVIARRWGPLPEVLGAMKAAGLDAIADAPVDLVSAADVGMAATAGLGPATLSVQHPVGEGRVALVQHARAIATANPTIRRFAPLAREQSVTVPTTGYHDVRMVALARLALPTVDVIEIDWVQYGPKLAQVALMFGATHLDRVSAVDDADSGPRRATVEEVRRNIVAAGLSPAEPGGAA